MRPTQKTILLATAGLAAALLPAVADERLWTLWAAGLAGLALGVGADAILCARDRDLRLRPRPPRLLYIGEDAVLPVRLRAAEGSRFPVVEILAELDEILEPPPLLRVIPGPGAGTEAEIPLRPRRRGTARLPALWLRWRGPLGLVARVVRRPLDLSLPVVPDVKAVRAAALRHFESREFLVGTKPRRYAGEGSEFSSLREYVPGLDHRSIDWKASARHTKLLAREFRAERNHQVVLAFDTGHLMGEPVEGVPRLDRAINAGLLLIWAGLKTGDRLGLFTFGDRVGVYAPPRGGIQAFPLLQRLSSEISYSTGETNYTLGLTSLLRRLSRRTLVVLFTEFVDTLTAELMIENLDRLARRHLVLFVSLKDPDLVRFSSARPRTLAALHRAVVADDLLREREIVLRRLARRGIHCLDREAREVTAALLDRYLLIKRRELL